MCWVKLLNLIQCLFKLQQIRWDSLAKGLWMLQLTSIKYTISLWYLRENIYVQQLIHMKNQEINIRQSIFIFLNCGYLNSFQISDAIGYTCSRKLSRTLLQNHTHMRYYNTKFNNHKSELSLKYNKWKAENKLK